MVDISIHKHSVTTDDMAVKNAYDGLVMRVEQLQQEIQMNQQKLNSLRQDYQQLKQQYNTMLGTSCKM